MASARCRVQFYRDKRGEYRWRYLAKNGRVLADSGESYQRKDACERSWQRVRFDDADTEYLWP
jgi:uncharacterized protein YegP (UPF0339 family)